VCTFNYPLFSILVESQYINKYPRITINNASKQYKISVSEQEVVRDESLANGMLFDGDKLLDSSESYSIVIELSAILTPV
jgi:hypothetical protein